MRRFRRAICPLVLFVGLSPPAARGDGSDTLVIEGGRVFDSASATLLEARTIVIRGDRITAVGGPDAPVRVPEGARRLDARGRYVIPGLIDAHVHVVHLADRTRVTGDEFLPMFLAAGVTSVRSAGDAIVAAAGVAHFAEAHPDRCPRVFLASPLIDGDPPVHADVGYSLTDVTKVASFVDDMAAWHVTTLKIYVGAPREIGRAVIEHGHRQGLVVTGHLGKYTAQDAVRDGIDCLEHIWSVFNYSIPDEVRKQPDYRANLDLHNPKCRALVAAVAEQDVAVDPTLVVFRNMIYLNDLPDVHDHPDLARVPERMRRYWDAYRAGAALAAETQDARRSEIAKYQALTGMLHDAGVRILAGTDAPEPYVVPGFSLHQEMELLVASGLEPRHALQAATWNNAQILQMHDHLGSIEVGKLADLVVLSADPVTEIRNTRRIEWVVRGGRVRAPEVLLTHVPGS